MTYRLSFRERLDVLEGALAIGRQADVLAPDEVRTRLATVQQSTTAPTSIPDSAVFSKIKSWFAPVL
jgi:hypothetical protein